MPASEMWQSEGLLPGRNVTCSPERMGHEESRSSTSRKQTLRTKPSQLDGSQSTLTERDAELASSVWQDLH